MNTEKPGRRPRYPGKNPRHFSEKYKEHAPEQYPETIAHVIAGGNTPAGMHRPVMLREVVEILAPLPGQVAVDCTLGYGGHAVALLKAVQPGGRLIGLEVDPIEAPKTERRLRALGFEEDALVVHRTNFAALATLLAEPADMVLADLGLSSMQIDNPTRGFTFKYPGPLDLRMNPLRGESADAFLGKMDAKSLSVLLRENADEPEAERMAEALLRVPVSTTTELAAVIRNVGGTDETVRRVFQALRIAVNDEFGALEAFLVRLPSCLKPGGRAAILTFHSGEDRRVKKSFLAGERSGLYEKVSREVVRASAKEVLGNPRSRSAKLHWVRRSAYAGLSSLHAG